MGSTIAIVVLIVLVLLIVVRNIYVVQQSKAYVIERLAAQDAVRALRHPAFAPLRADAAIAALEKNLQEEANHVEN